MYVYILKSSINNKYYIGCTNDLGRRLKDHNSGRNVSTKNGAPWIIIYYEEVKDQKEAYQREKQIKSYKGGNAFKKLLSL